MTFIFICLIFADQFFCITNTKTKYQTTAIFLSSSPSKGELSYFHNKRTIIFLIRTAIQWQLYFTTSAFLKYISQTIQHPCEKLQHLTTHYPLQHSPNTICKTDPTTTTTTTTTTTRIYRHFRKCINRKIITISKHAVATYPTTRMRAKSQRSIF